MSEPPRIGSGVRGPKTRGGVIRYASARSVHSMKRTSRWGTVAFIVLGLVAGIMAGALIAVEYDNMALGIAVGIFVGAVVGGVGTR